MTPTSGIPSKRCHVEADAARAAAAQGLAVSGLHGSRRQRASPHLHVPPILCPSGHASTGCHHAVLEGRQLLSGGERRGRMGECQRHEGDMHALQMAAALRQRSSAAPPNGAQAVWNNGQLQAASSRGSGRRHATGPLTASTCVSISRKFSSPSSAKMSFTCLLVICSISWSAR